MGRELSPCFECEERFLGCHSKCERYSTWGAENERIREARSKYLQSRVGVMKQDKVRRRN